MSSWSLPFSASKAQRIPASPPNPPHLSVSRSRPVYSNAVENIYFALTEAFNRDAPTVALASGQAVVYHQVAITALAEETDELRQRDAQRLARYEQAAHEYLAACRAAGVVDLPLRDAHVRLCAAAERWLPRELPESARDADAQ
jgi:hypothetical protein